MVALGYKIAIPTSAPPTPPHMSRNASAATSPASPSGSVRRTLLGLEPSPIPSSPDAIRAELEPDGRASSSMRLRRSSSPSKPQLPKLNDFELIRVLGKGCAGRVLLVKHTSTARVHAMKAISKRAVLANDELDHTLAEQRILRQFATRELRNAFISRLYYSFCDKENFYLVMEFYPGGDLATQMEIHGILGPLRTRFYTCDIVAGLEALHREGILVRDLKPENILLNWHGHAVLADFGLSKSFGYRGDPIPVKLPTDYIEGKGVPPPHAGKGFGTYREGELTWDRAFSFVGTQEYLAPEVIKRNHYTYAIDWWALGCIVCECLTGRVPFRGNDDESNAELYERVINAPWDAMYRGDHPRSYLKERYRMDSTTCDFVEGLLQKEPMFRLTEPMVKAHAYFTNVDWDTVDKGDYQDPFQLDIDPTAEYNTQFFPRLCLEETPTVDMSGHDYGKDPEGQQNCLNNDEIYAAAQVEFQKELESFEWTCHHTYDFDDQTEHSDEPNGHYDESMDEDLAVDEQEQAMASSVEELDPVIYHEVEDIAEEVEDMPMDTSEEGSAEVEPVPAAEPVPEDVPEPTTAPSPDAPPSKVTTSPSAAAPSVTSAPSVKSARSVKSATSLKVTSPSVKTPSVVVSSPPVSPIAASVPLPSSPLVPQVQVTAEPSTPSPEPHDLPITPDDPSPVGARIPSGPPLSGLSVSDYVSIPAGGQGNAHLIVRRHRQMPSIDTFPHARLSVDLGGTFAQLGDEDWEQLDADKIPEAPNGANVSGRTGLFRGINNMLNRRPSMARGVGNSRPASVRVPSGLRKPVGSDSETSSDRSPTKQRPPLFAARGIENTKRVFKTRVKAFPQAKPRPSTDQPRPSPSAPVSAVVSPAGSIRGVAPPPGRATAVSMNEGGGLQAPGEAASTSKRSSFVSALSPGKRSTARSGDLGSLFVRPKARRARTVDRQHDQHPHDPNAAPSRSSVSVTSGSTSTLESNSPHSPPHVPRVELTTTPPIVWELTLERTESGSQGH